MPVMTLIDGKFVQTYAPASGMTFILPEAVHNEVYRLYNSLNPAERKRISRTKDQFRQWIAQIWRNLEPVDKLPP
jgi:hypothetical protein